MKTPHRSDQFRSLALYSLMGVAGISLGVPFSSALAATSTSSFDVTAQVHSSCVISAQLLDFGTYDAVVANTDATSHLSVLCNVGEPYTIGLSPGSAGTANYGVSRTMKDGAKVLNYQLYRDPGRIEKWGTLGGSLFVKSGTGTGAVQNEDVYGRIPGGQHPGPGIYHDTITATISY